MKIYILILLVIVVLVVFRVIMSYAQTPKGNLITRYHEGPELAFLKNNGVLSIVNGIDFSVIYDTHDDYEKVEYSVYPVLLIMDESGTRSYYGNIAITDLTTPFTRTGSSLTEGHIPPQVLSLDGWRRVKNTEPDDAGAIESINLDWINGQTKIYLITKIRIL